MIVVVATMLSVLSQDPSHAAATYFMLPRRQTMVPRYKPPRIQRVMAVSAARTVPAGLPPLNEGFARPLKPAPPPSVTAFDASTVGNGCESDHSGWPLPTVIGYTSSISSWRRLDVGDSASATTSTLVTQAWCCRQRHDDMIEVGRPSTTTRTVSRHSFLCKRLYLVVAFVVVVDARNNGCSKSGVYYNTIHRSTISMV